MNELLHFTPALYYNLKADMIARNKIDGINFELNEISEAFDEQYKDDINIYKKNDNVVEKADDSVKEFGTSDYTSEYYLNSVVLKINPDTIRLLVEPLYDFNPACGLREIIQNACDACRERSKLEGEKSNSNYKGRISIEISTTDKYIEIIDNIVVS